MLIAGALLPAALTAYLAFRHGGFFPGAPALAAAELALLLALRFAFAREPLGGLGVPALAAVIALGGFAAWTLASGEWSGSPARALPEYTRGLLYALTLLFFALLPFSARRVRWMVYGLAAAVAGVCLFAFLARTMPDVVHSAADFRRERLGDPLGYWNTLGIFAAIGIVLCGHLACSSRDPRAVRVAAAAAVPLLTVTLYYTFSRAGTWSALAAVAVYVLVGRPRALATGALATVGPTVVALLAANPPGPLTGGDPLAPAAVAAGHDVALTVLLCALAAGAIRAALLPVDRRLDRLQLSPRVRRPALAAGAATAAAAALTAVVALQVPGVVEAKYREFTSTSDHVAGYAGASRLLSARNNGRLEQWEVSVDAFGRKPLSGSGAGTYPQLWLRDRESSVPAQDAHSLYVEVLGELGIVGLLALAVCLLLVLGAFAFRARGPDRPMFAALLAAGVAWALHASVDWDWEMPAVTLWLFAAGGAALAARRARFRVGPRTGIAVRILAVAGCLALAVIPARVAISEARLDRARDALMSGDCDTALAAARDAREALADRPAPHYVTAACLMRERRPAAAGHSLRRALELDPRNWELHYAQGVARAAAGKDPRRSLLQAARLNPHDELVSSLREAVADGGRQAWRRLGRTATLPPPQPTDP